MNWRKRPLTRIHINMHVIRRNKKHGEDEPPIAIRRQGKKTRYAHRVDILGPSSVIYSPEKPLSCGARCWIETYEPVLCIPSEDS